MHTTSHVKALFSSTIELYKCDDELDSMKLMCLSLHYRTRLSFNLTMH